MKKKRFSWSLPAIAIIILIYILTLFNWQAILPKMELASATEEKAYVKPQNLQQLQQADPSEVAKESKFDGRNYGIEMPVKDQNGYKICWAYATAHTVEASLLRSGLVSLRDKNSLDLEPRNIANNTFNHQPDPLGNNWQSKVENMDWNKGGWPHAVPQVFSQWRGLINSVWGSTNYLGYEKNLYQLNKAIYLPNDDRMAIKQAIVQYGAIAMAFPGGYNIKYFHEQNRNPHMGHAGSIIGWDDTIPKEQFQPHQPKTNGAWIVKDSYGTSPAEKGYFYMSYETVMSNMVAYDFVVQKRKELWRGQNTILSPC